MSMGEVITWYLHENVTPLIHHWILRHTTTDLYTGNKFFWPFLAISCNYFVNITIFGRGKNVFHIQRVFSLQVRLELLP
jgi:hypothetical protein